MTRYPFYIGAFYFAAMLLAVGALQQQAHAEESCGEFGTSVVFASSPAAAAKEARKHEKLVFVLHVSGNFETPDFT